MLVASLFKLVASLIKLK